MKKHKGRFKVPILKLWIVTSRELARLDSKIAILEGRYKEQKVRLEISRRRDADYLKTIVTTAHERLIEKLRSDNELLIAENEKMRRLCSR